MKKKSIRIVVAMLVFGAIASLYYVYIGNKFEGVSEHIVMYESFDVENTEDWYVATVEDDNVLDDAFHIRDGKLILDKTDDNLHLYLLSKPLALSKDKILRVRRTIKVNSGSGYFSGGMAIFQTNTNKRMLNLKAENNKGSALVLVEYVDKPRADSKRGSKKGVRILTPYWDKDGDVKHISSSVYGRFVEEEIVYDASTGESVYKIDGEIVDFETVELSDEYIRVWMHAYGEGEQQSIEVDKITIEIFDKEAGELYD